MELVEEGNLDPKQQNLYLKAQSALELLNYDFAISLLHSILKQQPGFQEGREMLRVAQGARVRISGKRGKGLLSGGMLKVRAKVKKDPLAALEDIEKRLDTDPYGVEPNTLLFEAFLALGMVKLAAFGLETVREGNPKNTKNLHKLGDHYLAQGDPGAAAKIYDLIVEQDSSDGAARKKAKDASAHSTMKTGGWESGSNDFRKLLKEPDATNASEKASRIGATLEQMEAQLTELGATYAEDPQNLAVVVEIADLYERLERWEEAASYFDYAYSLSASDLTLQRRAEDARDKQREGQIASLAADIAEGGTDAEDKRGQLEELRRATATQQIGEAKLRVERNPTDPQLRFDLGSLLFTSEEFREAIPHLQRAKNNPHLRIRAMLMLGRCYDAMSMFDLAVSTLAEANGELFAMDNTKKEVLYTLGLIYGKMSEEGKSIDSFKEIYNTDYDYRDVAKRVEESYTQEA